MSVRVSEHDRETIDQLFGAAADARSALDETFTAIDRVLANPSRAASLEESVDEVPTGEDGPAESELSCASESEGQLDAALMKNFLARRFPNDNEGSEAGSSSLASWCARVDCRASKRLRPRCPR